MSTVLDDLLSLDESKPSARCDPARSSGSGSLSSEASSSVLIFETHSGPFMNGLRTWTLRSHMRLIFDNFTSLFTNPMSGQSTVFSRRPDQPRSKGADLSCRRALLRRL